MNLPFSDILVRWIQPSRHVVNGTSYPRMTGEEDIVERRIAIRLIATGQAKAVLDKSGKVADRRVMEVL